MSKSPTSDEIGHFLAEKFDDKAFGYSFDSGRVAIMHPLAIGSEKIKPEASKPRNWFCSVQLADLIANHFVYWDFIPDGRVGDAIGIAARLNKCTFLTDFEMGQFSGKICEQGDY